MNPEPETLRLSDEKKFELLEHPELWPEDPALQAELAELLELHLALEAHGLHLQDGAVLRPSAWRAQSSWLMSAAAVLLALVPTLYAVQHAQYLHRVAKDRAHIEEVAQRRGQERLWAAFFQQSSELLHKFETNPPICQKDHEDRNPERELAMALLQASHQLAAQGAPIPEAEVARTDLHEWLTELSMEDGCMEPERAQELRQWAAAHNLEDETQRLGRLLKGDDR